MAEHTFSQSSQLELCETAALTVQSVLCLGDPRGYSGGSFSQSSAGGSLSESSRRGLTLCSTELDSVYPRPPPSPPSPPPSPPSPPPPPPSRPPIRIEPVKRRPDVPNLSFQIEQQFRSDSPVSAYGGWGRVGYVCVGGGVWKEGAGGGWAALGLCCIGMARIGMACIRMTALGALNWEG